MNPRHSIGASNVSWPRHIVAIQLKNLMPVGHRDQERQRALKNGRLTAPVVNMWWAQTAIDSAAMATVARTKPGSRTAACARTPG